MLDTDTNALTGDRKIEIGAISICPLCAAALDWSGPTIACTNAACGRRFRRTGGIPVLADEETSAIDFDPARGGANRSAVKSAALRHLPTLDLNVMPESAKARLREEIFALSPRPVILNVGGKHPTSMTEALCALPEVQAIECDLAHRARTRVFADPSRIPLADASVDAVLLDAVLEHVPDAHAVVREAWRVLRPGGIIFADTPFMLQVHGGAFDYGRFSHQAQRWMFRDFVEIDSGVSQGPGAALGYAIQYFLLSFVSGRGARYAVKTFCRLTLFWIKYFDLLVARRPAARDAAHGLYFIGRKSNRTLSEREVVARYDGAVAHLYPPQG